MPGTAVAFQPPRRRRLHQDVAEQLRDAILDGRFRTGEKLPPERELAEEFEVNRTSVREAIKLLEGLGLVVVRQGDGATVQPLVDASFDVLPAMVFHAGKVDLEVLGELGEVMQPLLVEMGRLAIQRCRPAHLVELHRLRDVVADASLEREVRSGALREVLVVLSDMTGNRVWRMLARQTSAFLGSQPMRDARGVLRRDPGRIVPIMDECLAAIEDGRRADAVHALERVILLAGEASRERRSASK